MFYSEKIYVYESGVEFFRVYWGAGACRSIYCAVGIGLDELGFG